MNIKTIATLSAGAIGTAATAFGPTIAAFAYPMQQGPTVFMAPPTTGFGRGNRTRVPTINWSYADSRPGVAPGQATGLYIWHDRNTVHVESTDNRWFGDDFRGSIEIVGGGKFDNIYNEHDKADTRFTLVNPNRLLFHFNAKDGDVDGFKFNIHGGRRLIFHIGEDGHPTARIYYGQARTPSVGDPVAFALDK